MTRGVTRISHSPPGERRLLGTPSQKSEEDQVVNDPTHCWFRMGRVRYASDDHRLLPRLEGRGCWILDRCELDVPSSSHHGMVVRWLPT